MSEDFIVYETTSAEIFLVDKKKVIECSDDSSQFIFFETLGKGSFSKVKRVERIWKSEDNEVLKSEYAMKIMHKGILKRQRCVLYDQNNVMKMTTNWEKIETEIEIWRSLCHVNVARLYEIINVAGFEHLYLVIEFCDKGQIMNWDRTDQKYKINSEIFPLLQTSNPKPFEIFSTKEAAGKLIFSQICQGLQYLHSKCIVHKDMKPDNILFSSKDLKCKITDFSISEKLSERSGLTYNPPGTIPFQAPESMLSGVGFIPEKSDIWALGVCIFCFMTDGSLPFWSPESEILTQMAIQSNSVNYPDSMSPVLRDLLEKMLEKDPDRRVGLEEILAHEWLRT
jgi:[calcium/calmodulin-dependent protein kinase] kinase